MLFKPEHIDLIVMGDKTQTRRVCKPGERSNLEIGGPEARHLSWMVESGRICCVVTASDREKWAVNKLYAVQPGRGKPGVWWHVTPLADGVHQWLGGEYRDRMLGDDWTPLRIRILDIRQERLQDISEDDAIAEGCTGYTKYTSLTNEGEPEYDATPREQYVEVWDAINTRPGNRWRDNPLVWALTFEPVRE